MSLAALEELCVRRFPYSPTREKIMAGLRNVLARIVDCGIDDGELWIDGSFLTEKIDPPDVDFVAMIPARFYDHGTAPQREVFDWLVSRKNEPKKLYLCDTSGEIVYDENSANYHMHGAMVEYWLRCYGRSVSKGEPKGIAVLRLKEVSLR